MIKVKFNELKCILFLAIGCLFYFSETFAQFIQPPTLIAPDNGTANLTTPVTLVWDHSSAISYRVQVSTDVDFNNMIIDLSGITNTYYEINILSDNTTYYWHVKASTLVFTSDWSSIWNFSTAEEQTIPSAPVLVSPSDEATDISLTPVLSWESIPNAEFYRLQVAEDVSFNNKVHDDSTITATSYQAGPLNEENQYFWRVNARNIAGVSNWSSVWNFTTVFEQTVPSAPVLISPFNSAIDESLYPFFTWEEVITAEQYRLQVSMDGSFNDIIYDDSTITIAYHQIGPLDPGTQYFWRVNARNDAGTGNWSDVWNFTTVPDENYVPILISPDDGLNNMPLSVLSVWDSVQSAQEYHIQVSTEPDFSTTFISEITTETYEQIENLNENTNYFWRVRAKVNNNWNHFAAAWRFTTRISTPTYIDIDTIINFPFYEDISEYKSSDYRIVGIPGTSYIPIINFLSGTLNHEWLAYWDNGGPNNYLVRYNESEFFYSIGKAFWIINKGAMQITATIENAPMNTRENVEIPLHSGWNLITNPLTFSVLWDSVKVVNSISEPIYSFNGSYNISQIFLPFQGFYFFNSTNLTILEIPTNNSENTPISVNHSLSKLIDENNWIVNIKLTSEGYTDSIAWLGVSSQVNDENNYLNYHKPRNWGSVPSIYFFRPEWDENYPIFASDIRPAFDDSAEWTIEIKSTAWKPVELTFELNEVPGSFDIYLFNVAATRWINLKENPTYQFTPIAAETSLKVMIGKDLEDKLIKTKPENFTLGNNFPNPFNLSTTIPVSIPDKSEVEISIFNILGNHIKTIYKGSLDAGQHWFRWDGTDNNRNTISSGVYFCRLKDQSKVDLMKKMLLIK